jgi:hypothetical protein
LADEVEVRPAAVIVMSLPWCDGVWPSPRAHSRPCCACVCVRLCVPMGAHAMVSGPRHAPTLVHAVLVCVCAYVCLWVPMWWCVALATCPLSPMLCLCACAPMCAYGCPWVFCLSLFCLVLRRRAETFSPDDEVSHKPHVMVPTGSSSLLFHISSVFSSGQENNKFVFQF